MSFLDEIKEEITDSYFEVNFAEMKKEDKIEIILEDNLNNSIQEGISKKKNKIIKIKGTLQRESKSLQLPKDAKIEFRGHKPSIKKAIIKAIAYKTATPQEQQTLMYTSYGMKLTITKISTQVVQIIIE